MRGRVICLFDDTPETLACVFTAQRLADGLDAALTINASDRHAELDDLILDLQAGDDIPLAIAVPWRGRSRQLRELLEAFAVPLLALAPNGARRLRAGIHVSERIVARLAHPDGDAVATQHVAAAAAAALGDWLWPLDARGFRDEPGRTGHAVELIVCDATALACRPWRQALRAAPAPLLIVPAGSEDTWPRPACAPLAFTPDLRAARRSPSTTAPSQQWPPVE